MGMNLVIPGGSGQVGGVITRALAAAGHDPVILSRAADGASGRVRRVHCGPRPPSAR
jgi:uncharacterized protein YbjT (DUF2867 family)